MEPQAISIAHLIFKVACDTSHGRIDRVLEGILMGLLSIPPQLSLRPRELEELITVHVDESWRVQVREYFKQYLDTVTT